MSYYTQKESPLIPYIKYIISLYQNFFAYKLRMEKQSGIVLKHLDLSPSSTSESCVTLGKGSYLSEPWSLH